MHVRDRPTAELSADFEAIVLAHFGHVLGRRRQGAERQNAQAHNPLGTRICDALPDGDRGFNGRRRHGCEEEEGSPGTYWLVLGPS